VFERPALAKDLRTVHVLTPGDLDARYLGDRATLEPLFASYGMPANSDYYPVLDLNAAKHRFMERSAVAVVGLLNAGVPVLELLEPSRSSRPVNPLHRGGYAFDRVENTRLARYARDFLLSARAPEPQDVPASLQKDLELVKARLLECRQPRELDVWLHSALHVAKALNPYLPAAETGAVWRRIGAARCHAVLPELQRRWVALFRAVAERDAVPMAELASELLAAHAEMNADSREYLMAAGMAGYIVAQAPEHALTLWKYYAAKLHSGAAQPVFRLLRCHAEKGDARACAASFRDYAEL